MDDDLGARKGGADGVFHFVGDFVRLQQGQVAIQLHMQLNEGLHAR